MPEADAETGARPERLTRPPGADGCLELPPSHGQRRLWLVCRRDPANPVYHYAMFLRVEGPLDTGALRTALGVLTARHESLRTTLHSLDGELVQRVHPAVPAELPVHTAADWESAHAAAVREARRPMDLARGPLLRTWLMRVAPDLHLFSCVVHHAVFDGWSEEVFWRELAASYNAAANGTAAGLPELPVQHGDVAAWQNTALEGAEGQRLVDYWGHALDGARPLALPTDRPRPPAPEFRGATHRFPVPPEVARRLREFCREEHLTLYTVLLAATSALLGRWSDQDEVAVTVTTANRPLPEAEHTIGYFAGGQVLRTRLTADQTFRDLCWHVLETFLDGMEHEGLPLDVLTARTRPGWERAGNAFSRVAVALDPVLRLSDEFAGLRVRQVSSYLGVAKWDLGAVFQSDGEDMLGHLTYDTALFDAETAESMAEALLRLLDEAVRDPDRPLRAIGLGSAGEHPHGSGPAGSGPADDAGPGRHSVPHHVAAQAARTPRAPAVHAPDGSLSYGELDRRTDSLAALLGDRGVGPRTVVGLGVPPSADFVVALLAVLKAGGTVALLDMSWLAGTLERALSSCGARLLLTVTGAAPPVPDGVGVLRLDQDVPGTDLADRPAPAAGPGIAGAAGAVGEPAADAHACVLPPTGDRPGPVAFTHEALCGPAGETGPRDLGPGTVHLHLAPPASAHAVTELLGPLFHGGAVALPRAGDGIRAALEAYAATSALFTGATLRAATDQAPEALTALREVLVEAEELSSATVGRALALLDGRPLRIVHGAGAGWAGVATAALVSAVDVPSGSGVPVGSAVDPRTRTHVLDRELRPVPAGAPGELYLGGAGMAQGYAGQGAATAGRFVPDPFSGRPGARLYRTGELVRSRRDGGIEYLGRLADRHESGGVRVETGPVRDAVAAHPAVADVAVLARDDLPDGTGRRGLVAYVTPAPGARLDTAALREHAGGLLHTSLIPDAFVSLPALPLTAEGTVDRRALPAPMASAVAADPGPSGGAHRTPSPEVPPGADPPRTHTERVVAEEWGALTGQPPPHREAKFLESGGDSVLLVLFAERLRERFPGRAPAVVELFEFSTVPQIAGLVDGRAGNHAEEAG